jgi:uncharacterized RDD family membrane protein YckC
MFCPNCGRKNDEAARFCQSCGGELTAPARESGAVSYAGFWKRVAALLIDSIVISAASGLLTAVTFGMAWFSIFFLPWVYEAIMLSSEKQATFGKMLLGIAVTDLNGSRISFGRATGRHFAKWLSALILGIGFLMAAFTERKQALHDMIADTLVVNRAL